MRRSTPINQPGAASPPPIDDITEARIRRFGQRIQENVARGGVRGIAPVTEGGADVAMQPVISIDLWTFECARCGWKVKSELTVNHQQSVAEALILVHLHTHDEQPDPPAVVETPKPAG